MTVADAGPIESPIALVDSAVTAGNSTAPSVTVPAAATPGDRLLLVLSHNSLSRSVGAPTGVAGWTQLDSLAAGTMGTVAWTKVVQPGDPGSRVSVPLSGTAKFTLTLAAYTGTETTPGVPFAATTFVAPATSRRTPVVPASLGDWVVSYWADKSSTTTAWTPASTVTARRAACAADGGRVCSVLADSGAPFRPPPTATSRPRPTLRATKRPCGRSCSVPPTVGLRPTRRPQRPSSPSARCSSAASTPPARSTPTGPDHVVRLGLRRRHDRHRAGPHPLLRPRPAPTTSR